MLGAGYAAGTTTTYNTHIQLPSGHRHEAETDKKKVQGIYSLTFDPYYERNLH